jgi:hypothetical protein
MPTVQACSLLPAMDAVVEAVGVRRVDADVAVGAEGVEAVVAGVAVVVAVVVAAAVAVFGLALSASVKRVPPPAGWILT